jgi:hypothetical protein
MSRFVSPGVDVLLEEPPPPPPQLMVTVMSVRMNTTRKSFAGKFFMMTLPYGK